MSAGLRTWESLSLDGWIALRRVERVGCAGNVIARDNLMRRKLIEWVPGESGLRLTARGREALQARDRNMGAADDRCFAEMPYPELRCVLRAGHEGEHR